MRLAFVLPLPLPVLPLLLPLLLHLCQAFNWKNLHNVHVTTRECALSLIALAEEAERIRLGKRNDERMAQIVEEMKKERQTLQKLYFSIRHLFSSLGLTFTKELYLFGGDGEKAKQGAKKQEDNPSGKRFTDEQHLRGVKTERDLKALLGEMISYYKKEFIQRKAATSCSYINRKNSLRKQIEIVRYTHSYVATKLYYREYAKYFQRFLGSGRGMASVLSNPALDIKEGVYSGVYANYGGVIAGEPKDGPKGKPRDGSTDESQNGPRGRPPTCSDDYKSISGEQCTRQFAQSVKTMLHNFETSLQSYIHSSVVEMKKQMIQVEEQQEGENYCRDMEEELKDKSYDKISMAEIERFEQLSKNYLHKDLDALVQREKKKMYRRRNFFERYFFFIIERMLQVRRGVEAALGALSREPATAPSEPLTAAKGPLSRGPPIKRTFQLLDEYISMYSFAYEHLKDYHLNVRDLFSLDYIRENSKDNRAYIAERIAQKMDALNGSFLKYKNVKNRYEQCVEKGIRRSTSMGTLKKGESVSGGGKNVQGREFPELWASTWERSSHSFLSEEDKGKKDKLNGELIEREDEYLRRLQNVVKLLSRYKKLKNKKVKIRHIVNIGKVEMHPILFNLKLRKDQMVGFYRSILHFGKIFVAKRIVLTLKMKLAFLGRVTPSAFLLSNRFLLLLYETHLGHLQSSYKIGVNKNFCHDLTLENLDGVMKQGDLPHLLLKYVIYMFGLNSAYMSEHLGGDLGPAVGSSDYIGGSNAANGDANFGEDDPPWGAHNLRVVYELARNFTKRPLIHAADFFQSGRTSPNGESNTHDEQVENAFRQMHSYFSSIFNSDEISGHILKQFESWEERSSSGCYEGHSCSMEIPVYSKDVIRKSIFYNLHGMGDEFDVLSEATVSSVSSCATSAYSYVSSAYSYVSSPYPYATSPPLKFPSHLLTNAIITNSLSEAYKYMLYKTQQSQAFKLYSRSKGTNITLLETVFLQLILNFGMAPYNKLKGTMVSRFCRKKGRVQEDETSSKTLVGSFQYGKRKRNFDFIPHIRYVPKGEQLQAGLAISCSEMKQIDGNASHKKTPTKWWNTKRGSNYSPPNNSTSSHRMHHLGTCELLNGDKQKMTSFEVQHVEYIPNGMAFFAPVVERQNVMSDYELYGLFFQGARWGEEEQQQQEQEQQEQQQQKKRNSPEEGQTEQKRENTKEDIYCSEEKLAYFFIGESVVYPSEAEDVEEPLIGPILSKSAASQREILFERESMEQYNMILNWLYRSQEKKNWNREKVRKIEREISVLRGRAKLYEENISHVRGKMAQMRRPPGEGSDLQREYQREVSNAAREKYNSLMEIYEDTVELFRESERNLTKVKKQNEREGEKVDAEEEEEPGVDYYGLRKYALLRKHQVEDLNMYTTYHEQIMKYFQKQNRCCDAYIKEMTIHLQFFPQVCCPREGERQNEEMLKYIYISITDLVTDFVRCENNTNRLLTHLKKVKDTLHTINTVNANLHKKKRTFHLSTKYFYREKKEENIYFFTDKVENVKTYKIYRQLIDSVNEDLLFITHIMGKKLEERKEVLQQVEEKVPTLLDIKRILYADKEVASIHVETLCANFSHENMINYDKVKILGKNFKKKIGMYKNVLKNIRYSFENEPQVSNDNLALFYNFVEYDSEVDTDAMQFADALLAYNEGGVEVPDRGEDAKNAGGRPLTMYQEIWRKLNAPKGGGEKRAKERHDDGGDDPGDDQEGDSDRDLYADWDEEDWEEDSLKAAADRVEKNCRNRKCPLNSFCFIQTINEECLCLLNYSMVGEKCILNEQNSCAVKNGGCDLKATCELKKNRVNCICPKGTKPMHEGVVCSFSFASTLSQVLLLFAILAFVTA
ncbi:merozoite surface protein 1 paralog [Plasmodium vivax]|uniref:Merozoite surface protein 1 paralog n=1 Tax=Plasmodium vivax TaxID=5855 RepID=A0A1G4HAZ9_PLAVI|nr:merozoite surface protein 1 paralog [Plasmodium vivax]